MLSKNVVTAAITFALSACMIGGGSSSTADAASRETSRGPVETRPFALSGFDAIDLGGCDRVTVTLGNRFAVTARGPARDLALLDAEVRGDTLRLRRELHGCDGEQTSATYAVTLPDLRAVDISGAGVVDLPPLSRDAFTAEISGAGQLAFAGLSAEEARLRVSGAGKLSLRRARIDRLDIRLSGAGEVEADGRAEALAIAVSGTGDVDTRDLAAETLSASASGTGTVRARASGPVTIAASGMATVRVEGGGACAIDTSGRARATCN